MKSTVFQAIIWTNDDYVIDAYMRHSASMSKERKPIGENNKMYGSFPWLCFGQ